MATEARAHTLVEELMIATNEVVAARCLQVGAPALYRAHDPPEPDAVATLYARLEALDVPTPPLPEHLGPMEAARAAASPRSWSRAMRPRSATVRRPGR